MDATNTDTLWGKWIRIDVRVRLALMLAIFIAECLFIVWTHSIIDRHDQRRADYISQHKCVREGFAGRSATPVYRCDTGLWLEHELGKGA